MNNGLSMEGEPQARKHAEEQVCSKYCQTVDPAVDKAWKDYKKTPAGAKSTLSREADVMLVSTIKPILTACDKQCKADVAADKAKLETSCSVE